MMSHPPSNDLLFGQLTDCIRGKKCTAILGAGVSSPDYPAWSVLTDQLRLACEVRAEDLYSDQLPDVLEVAKKKNPSRFIETLRTIFARRE
jgi:predicted mannosyl-3-phosphoglycerate phosphatase (HAD superfamily)